MRSLRGWQTSKSYSRRYKQLRLVLGPPRKEPYRLPHRYSHAGFQVVLYLQPERSSFGRCGSASVTCDYTRKSSCGKSVRGRFDDSRTCEE
jgi:hypothetical protein